MTETVHVVTDLPAKSRFSFNPKVAVGAVIGIAVVGTAIALKGRLSETSTEETENVETETA